MKLATFLYDIVDILQTACPEIDAVRLRPANGGCEFSGRDGDRYSRGVTVVLFARTHEPVEGLDGPVTLHELGCLRSALMAPGMSRQAAAAVIAGDRRSVRIESKGHDYRLPVLDERLTDEYLGGVLPLKSPVPFQVHVEPNRVGVELLKYWRNELSDCVVDGEHFFPYTDRGRLMCRLGETPTAHTAFPFVDFVSGQLPRCHSYSTDLVVRLASLVNRSRSTVLSFSDAGLCRVQVRTNCATYDFLVPGVEP